MSLLSVTFFSSTRMVKTRLLRPKNLLALIVPLVLSGCSTYQNFTAYFNTYYNASHLFQEAVDEVERTPMKSLDTLYFNPYAAQAATSQKFDKVIEKCSHIIESYGQSKYADDAVLMIGKSFVYKGENESGVRKFQEFLQSFPTSDLRREAKLWNAKAEFFMKKEDVALKILEDLYDEARSEGDNEILF